MNVPAPLHVLGLQPDPKSRDSERVRVVRASDVKWGLPIFRAPTLPTPRQLGSELPFSVNFPRAHGHTSQL